MKRISTRQLGNGEGDEDAASVAEVRAKFAAIRRRQRCDRVRAYFSCRFSLRGELRRMGLDLTRISQVLEIYSFLTSFAAVVLFLVGTYATGVYRYSNPNYMQRLDKLQLDHPEIGSIQTRSAQENFANLRYPANTTHAGKLIFPRYVDAFAPGVSTAPYVGRKQVCTRFNTDWYGPIRGFLSTALVLDYSIRFYMSEALPYYFFHAYALADWISLSAFVPWIMYTPKIALDSFGFLKSLRFLRGTELIRRRLTQVRYRLLMTCVTLFCLFFCFAGVVLTVGFPSDITNSNAGIASGKDFICFHDAFYFAVVTCTTVGYGEFSASQTVTRLCCIIFMVLGVSLFSYQINRLMASWAAFPRHREKHESGGSNKRHIVVTGNLDANALYALLHELFHPNHDSGDATTQPRVMLMSMDDNPPSDKLLTLIEDHQYSRNVRFYRGHGHSPSDIKTSLMSCNAQDAESILVLTDKDAPNPESQDMDTLMFVKGIRKLCPGRPIIAQVIEPSNKAHVRRAGASQIVCIKEIQSGMVAQTSVCRGLIPFLSNLFQSSDGEGSAYDRGLGFEVYYVEASPWFYKNRITFRQVRP